VVELGRRIGVGYGRDRPRGMNVFLVLGLPGASMAAML
jgi:hypothetical protein